MYDSENIPLATRIQAGDGVTITYATNSDGEGVFTAAVDQTWLTAWVNANSSGSLKLNDSDMLRLRAVEERLGIEVNASVAPVASPTTGTPGTTDIAIAADVATLTGDVTMSYNLNGIDGTVLVTETMTANVNSQAPVQILTAIYGQMIQNTSMLRFMAPTFDTGTDILTLTWNDANTDSTFTYEITSQGTGDNVVITATDY